MVFTGCSSYGGASLIYNSDGTMAEAYYIPFPQEEMIRLLGNNFVASSEVSAILSKAKKTCDQNFQSIISEYQTKVQNSTEYTDKEKQSLIYGVYYKSNLPEDGVIVIGRYTKIVYELRFSNSTCYKVFKNISNLDESTEVEYENNFFVTTKKVTKSPLFDLMVSQSLTIGQNMLNEVDKVATSVLGEVRWSALKEALNYATYASSFEYKMVVPTARIKTNADSVTEKDGYYYHVWNIPVENKNADGESVVKIEYWTTTANKWVWYVFTATLGLMVSVGVIVYSNIKNKSLKKES